MPIDHDPAVQLAAYAGAATAGDIEPDHLAVGGRLGRGPLAAVVEGRLALRPDQPDTMALVVADILGGEGPYPSLVDTSGAAVAVELGVPVFGARFSGGPFIQAGVDVSTIRRTRVAMEEGIASKTSSELVPAVGARLAAGATWCLARNLGVRLQVTDVIRSSSLLTEAQPESFTGPAPLPILGDVVVMFSVYAGGEVVR